jgi:hypothetical protein
MTDPATTFYAVATATALAGIGAATAWAIQARVADRARRDAERSLTRQLAEINQAKLALAAAEKEIALLSNERDLLRAKLDALSLRESHGARNCDRFATEDEARDACWAYRDPLEFDDKPFATITEWLFMPIGGESGKGGEA